MRDFLFKPPLCFGLIWTARMSKVMAIKPFNKFKILIGLQDNRSDWSCEINKLWEGAQQILVD